MRYSIEERKRQTAAARATGRSQMPSGSEADRIGGLRESPRMSRITRLGRQATIARGGRSPRSARRASRRRGAQDPGLASRNSTTVSPAVRSPSRSGPWPGEHPLAARSLQVDHRVAGPAAVGRTETRAITARAAARAARSSAFSSMRARQCANAHPPAGYFSRSRSASTGRLFPGKLSLPKWP